MRRFLIALVALAGATFLVAPATASSTATFSVRPDAGPPGTVVTVASVTPCPENPSGVVGPRVVDVSLDQGQASLASIRVSPDAAGSWTGSLTVPDSASPGSAELSAFCLSSAEAEGATLAYDPQPFTIARQSAQPIPGTPGLTG